MSGDPASQRRLRAVPSDDAVAAQLADRSEDALIELARDGDAAAWARIYERSFDGIYRHLGRMVTAPTVAEELAQETFVVAFRKLRDFDGRATLSTWLHGIAVNLARSHFRKEARRRRAYGRVAEASDSVPVQSRRRACPELSHEREQRARALLAAVERLPPRLREAFVLMELRQLPRDEVAELLGASRMAVSVRVSRARKQIHARLERDGWLDDEGGSA